VSGIRRDVQNHTMRTESLSRSLLLAVL